MKNKRVFRVISIFLLTFFLTFQVASMKSKADVIGATLTMGEVCATQPELGPIFVLGAVLVFGGVIYTNREQILANGQAIARKIVASGHSVSEFVKDNTVKFTEGLKDIYNDYFVNCPSSLDYTQYGMFQQGTELINKNYIKYFYFPCKDYLKCSDFSFVLNNVPESCTNDDLQNYIGVKVMKSSGSKEYIKMGSNSFESEGVSFKVIRNGKSLIIEGAGFEIFQGVYYVFTQYTENKLNFNADYQLGINGAVTNVNAPSICPDSPFLNDEKEFVFPVDDVITVNPDIPLNQGVDVGKLKVGEVFGDTAGTIAGDMSIPITGTGEDTGEDTGEGVGDLDLTVPSDVKLDFSPLSISLKGKFPFCIPFDLVKTIKSFKAESVAPKFTITFPKVYGIQGGSFVWDFGEFESIVLILRYFLLLVFVVNLIKITRMLIRG